MIDVPSPDDDLQISAYLDGVATPDECAAVESDPAKLARLAEFQAVRDRVAEPVGELRPETLEAMVAAALAQAETVRPAPEEPAAPGQADTSASTSPVTSLAATRRDRSSARWLAVAAVVLFALAIPIAIVVVNRQGSDASDKLAFSSASSTVEDTDARADPGSASSNSATDSPITTSSASPTVTGGASNPGAPMTAQLVAGDLGTASTDDELRVLVNDAVTHPPPTVVPSTQPPGPTTTLGIGPVKAVDMMTCEPAAQAVVPDAQALRISGQLTYAGEEAYGYVFVTPSGFTAVIVSSDPARSCAVLARLPL